MDQSSNLNLSRDLGSEGHGIFHSHRVTGCLRLEGTSGGHLVQASCSSRATWSQLPSTMSRQLLNVSKEGDIPLKFLICLTDSIPPKPVTRMFLAELL